MAKPRTLSGVIETPGGDVPIVLTEKEFSSGNTGWFATLPRFIVGEHQYGGSVQVYRMDRKKDQSPA